ncbi:fatty-acid amide hydrolase 2-A-like [Brevipalpus obovatus]|uniref:fatty-acid amide hydrolase 2-A-like n=1 Tax=Brevipalpus obovatus TaxID=246614 RepID=UPI003D9F73A0
MSTKASRQDLVISLPQQPPLGNNIHGGYDILTVESIAYPATLIKSESKFCIPLDVIAPSTVSANVRLKKEEEEKASVIIINNNNNNNNNNNHNHNVLCEQLHHQVNITIDSPVVDVSCGDDCISSSYPLVDRIEKLDSDQLPIGHQPSTITYHHNINLNNNNSPNNDNKNNNNNSQDDRIENLADKNIDNQKEQKEPEMEKTELLDSCASQTYFSPIGEILEAMSPSMMTTVGPKRMSNFGIFVCKSFRFLSNTISTIVSVLTPSVKRSLPPITDPILLQPAHQLILLIKSGQLKCETVIQAYIDRLQEVQPYLNAIVDERFESALEDARKIDSKICSEINLGISADDPSSIRRLPLLGLPLTCKDSIAIKGLLHDSGSLLRKDVRADRDAFVVATLKEAGAIFLALSNVPELLLWFDSHNNVHGRTNNPYDLSRIPGGSSGGEGALVSSAASIVGIGSDIGGSIRIPSFYCGLFGHAPTPGVLSVDGMYPTPCKSWARFLSFGPICRYASDMKPVLKAMAGSMGKVLNLDEEVSFKDITIYYMEDDGGSPLTRPVVPEIREAMHKALDHFKSKYNTRVEKINYPRAALAFPIWGANIGSGDAWTLAEEAVLRNGSIHPTWELIKFMFYMSSHSLGLIFISLLERLCLKKGSPFHTKLCEKKDTIRNHFLKTLGNKGVLFYPTLPIPAIKHRTTVWNAIDCGYTMLSNLICFPATHCPTGLNKEGLPIGFQIIAPPYKDNVSISIACELEKLFGGWTSPSSIEC